MSEGRDWGQGGYRKPGGRDSLTARVSSRGAGSPLRPQVGLRHKLKVRQQEARLAQSVEHQTLNLVVVGSSPTLGDSFFCFLAFAGLLKGCFSSYAQVRLFLAESYSSSLTYRFQRNQNLESPPAGPKYHVQGGSHGSLFYTDHEPVSQSSSVNAVGFT